MKTKNYLVKYTHVCGGYEFSGQIVLCLKPKQTLSAAVHAYFKDYYDEENLDEATKGSYYLYNGGEVAVKNIVCHPLSEANARILSDFHL